MTNVDVKCDKQSSQVHVDERQKINTLDGNGSELTTSDQQKRDEQADSSGCSNDVQPLEGSSAVEAVLEADENNREVPSESPSKGPLQSESEATPESQTGTPEIVMRAEANNGEVPSECPSEGTIQSESEATPESQPAETPETTELVVGAEALICKAPPESPRGECIENESEATRESQAATPQLVVGDKAIKREVSSKSPSGESIQNESETTPESQAGTPELVVAAEAIEREVPSDSIQKEYEATSEPQDESPKLVVGADANNLEVSSESSSEVLIGNESIASPATQADTPETQAGSAPFVGSSIEDLEATENICKVTSAKLMEDDSSKTEGVVTYFDSATDCTNPSFPLKDREASLQRLQRGSTEGVSDKSGPSSKHSVTERNSKKQGTVAAHDPETEGSNHAKRRKDAYVGEYKRRVEEDRAETRQLMALREEEYQKLKRDFNEKEKEFEKLKGHYFAKKKESEKLNGDLIAKREECEKLKGEVEARESMWERFHRKKLTELGSSMHEHIEGLKAELDQVKQDNIKLHNQLSVFEQKNAMEVHRGSYLDDSKAATPALLVSALNGVKDASNHFAKVLKSHVESSNSSFRTDIETQFRNFFGEVTRQGHVKFHYQAYACEKLFAGFGDKSFQLSLKTTERIPQDALSSMAYFFRQYQMHDLKSVDTVGLLLQHDSRVDPFLHEFCFDRFPKILPEGVEKSLSGNHDLNRQVRQKKHPQKSTFYTSYCKLAVSVWLLHRLAFSFREPATLLSVHRGQPFDTARMQSVVPLDEPSPDDEEAEQLKVGFPVLQGFQVSKSVIPSEVYLIN